MAGRREWAEFDGSGLGYRGREEAEEEEDRDSAFRKTVERAHGSECWQSFPVPQKTVANPEAPDLWAGGGGYLYHCAPASRGVCEENVFGVFFIVRNTFIQAIFIL